MNSDPTTVNEPKISFNPYTYEGSSINENRKAMAYAISKEMKANVEFRKAIYAKLEPNQFRFKEIVLGQFKNKLINGISVETLLNKHLSEIIGVQRDEPVLSILMADPLLTLWMPNDYIYSMPDGAFTDVIPVSAVVDNTTYLFKNGLVASGSADPLSVFTMYLTESPNSRLFDMNSQEYINPNISFSDFHKMPAEKNVLALQKIASFPDYEFSTGKKLVNTYEDIYVEFVMGGWENQPFGPPGPPPPPAECTRAILSLQYPDNSNFLEAWKFESLANLSTMSLHPCENSAAIANGAKFFHFTWAFADDGEIQEVPRYMYLSVLKSQLLKITIIWKQKWDWLSFDYVLVPASITKELLWVPFPQLNNFLFSNEAGQNSWTPEENGNLVYIDVKQVYPGTCTSSFTNTTVESFKINSTIKFGQVIAGSQFGSASVEYTSTQTRVVNFSITAGPIWDWGKAQFGYCQPFKPNTWISETSTSSVAIRLNSPHHD